MTWWPQFRVIDTAVVTPDPEMADVVAKYEADLGRHLDTPIGTTAVELDSRNTTVRSRETAIGALVADAMRWSAQTEAAITNGGGIRGGKVYPPGAILTRRDVLAELPFGNRLVTLSVSGAVLMAAIENGLSKLPSPSGRFPQVSGLTIEADVSRPPGSRVISVKVGDAPLDPARTYTLATNDFMARGGDDYVMFRDIEPVLPVADSPTLAYEVIDYIVSVGTVTDGGGGKDCGEVRFALIAFCQTFREASSYTLYSLHSDRCKHPADFKRGTPNKKDFLSMHPTQWQHL